MRLPKNREVDSATGFLAFVDRNQDYVKGFRSKWIESELPNRLLVDYEFYISNPMETLTRVVNFFDDGIEVDESKINRIVEDVKPAKVDSQFRYYDAVAHRTELWTSTSGLTSS